MNLFEQITQKVINILQTEYVECANGDKHWYLNGKLHREDGPAVEHADGSKYWFLNGQLHREDGPAAEWANGSKYWYLNGTWLTEQEFNKRTNESI